MDSDARVEAFSFWTVLGVGLAVATVVLLFFASFAEPFSLRGDNKLVHFPMKLEAWRQWTAGGNLPFWSNGLWSGFALLGDATTGAWYLPHAIGFLVTPSPHLRAFDVAVATHAGLLAAGSLVLLRRLGCGAVGCAFGVVLLLFASHVLAWTAYLPGFSSLAWWPWVLVAADRLTEPDVRTLRAIWVGSIPLGAQVLAGYPEMGLYSGCMAAVWILFARGGASPSQRIIRTVGLAAASALLAGPQLIPSAFAMLDSTRAVSLDVRGLLALQGSFADVIDPSVGSRELAVLNPFLGGATLLLAGFAVFRRVPRSGVLASIAIVAALASLGERTPVYGLLSEIPLFELFRGPHKLFLITQLSAMWLAALGVDALLRRSSRTKAATLAASILGLAALGEHATSFAFHLPRVARGHTRVELEMSEATEVLAAVAPVLTQPVPPDGPPPRVYTASWISAMGSLPMIVGIEATRGGGVALLSPRHQWMRMTELRPAQLDALGVQYVFRKGACENRRLDDPIALRGEEFCVRFNPDASPRYELQRRVRRGTQESAIHEMSQRRPPATVAVVAPDSVVLPGGDGPAGEVEVLAYRPGRVELRVRAAGDRLLLVRESWAPGWEARIDGEPGPVYPAAAIFFAVPVPSGTHTVSLQFEAPGYRAGLALGGVWILLALWACWRPRQGAGGASSTR